MIEEIFMRRLPFMALEFSWIVNFIAAAADAGPLDSPGAQKVARVQRLSRLCRQHARAT